MKIVRDPDIYGQEAERGVFIPLSELRFVGGLKSFKNVALKRYHEADRKRERYQDIQDSGDASSRQQTSLDKWNEETEKAEKVLKELQDIKIQCRDISE